MYDAKNILIIYSLFRFTGNMLSYNLPLSTKDDIAHAVIKEAKDLADSILGSELSPRPSGLLSVSHTKTISSPVKESLSGSDSPRNVVYYEKDWRNEQGVHMIQFRAIDKHIVVPVLRNDCCKVLNFSTDSDGSLNVPTFVKGSKRADFLRHIFKDNTPDHFMHKHVRGNIHGLSSVSGKKPGKRGGKTKKHSFLIHWSGKCEAHIDGCPSTYEAGITEKDLCMIADGTTDSVRVTMIVSHQCVHVWKKKYGRAIGAFRKQQVDEIANEPDKLVRPSERAKRNLIGIDANKFTLGNHAGYATDRQTQYELAREAKAKLRKDLNLTSDMLTNVINVCRR